MEIIINLEYTPRSPRLGVRYTESSFVRSASAYTFQTNEIGIVLVDLWNFGWDDGPIANTLDWELSTERGVSHALNYYDILLCRERLDYHPFRLIKDHLMHFI